MKRSISKHLFVNADIWSPREKLVKWGHGTGWSVGQSYEGSIHLGASGSGKTSGGVRLQTAALMRAGYGILFATTKATTPSDADMCWELARTNGRENSIVAVGPQHHLGFNILRHEMQATQKSGYRGDLAGNVASFFTTAAELAMPRRESSGGDHIWRQAVETLVRHAVTVVFRATDDLRLNDIISVIKSAPQNLAQSKDPTWRRESSCAHMIAIACDREGEDRNVQLAHDFFLDEFAKYSPETKNSVLFTFSSGCADLFQREPLHGMFFAGTDYTPEILLDGAILLCDCPVNEYREIGRIANGLLRLSVQRMLERRAGHPSERPVAIIWDECQKTLLRSDVTFQETARSAKCATIAATQHIPTLTDVVGKDLVSAFLGNLRTKVFWQNNESETGEYMRKICGRKEVSKVTKSRGASGDSSYSETSVWEDVLPPQATHNLKTGGKENGYKVTGFIIIGSKKLRRNEPFQKILVHQKKLGGGWLTRRARVVARARPCPDFRYLSKERF